MFCGKCGSEIQEGLEICPKCSKSSEGLVVEGEDTKMASYPLINLSSKLFYPIFELGLWIFLIAGTIGGGWIGRAIGEGIRGYNSGAGGAFLGAIIGFLVTLVIMISWAGLISIFLKINENIEKLKNK